MGIPEIHPASRPDSLSRRAIFSFLPARAVGCMACANALACAQVSEAAQAGHSWTEKADITWEEMFRFAYQKDLIPMLQELAAQLGREKFLGMLREAIDEVVRKRTAGRPPAVTDLVSFAAAMKKMPPLIQHALEAEIVQQSAEAFEPRQKVFVGKGISRLGCRRYRLCDGLLPGLCCGEGTQSETGAHPYQNIDAGRRQLQPSICDENVTSLFTRRAGIHARGTERSTWDRHPA
jgi:hypothetical protein